MVFFLVEEYLLGDSMYCMLERSGLKQARKVDRDQGVTGGGGLCVCGDGCVNMSILLGG